VHYRAKLAMQKLIDEIEAVNGTGIDAHSPLIESAVRETTEADRYRARGTRGVTSRVDDAGRYTSGPYRAANARRARAETPP